jgi:hypothetical protein
MTTEPVADIAMPGSASSPAKALSSAARRALEEAEERRAQAQREAPAPAVEINGRGGLDPARFGDWEVKGLAVDF